MNPTMTSTASMHDIARAIDADGAAAFDRLDAFQRASVVDALEAHDVDALERFATLAVEALEALADDIDDKLEALESEYADALRSQDRLSDFAACMDMHELNESATRERLESLLDDSLTPDEFERLGESIAAGMHDGKAPGEDGPFKAWDTIWASDDAFLSWSDDGEEFIPVSDALEKRLGEFFDKYKALADAGALEYADESRDAFDFFRSVTLVDGAREGVGECFALCVRRPVQILYFVDVEGVAEELKEYRAEESEQWPYVGDDKNVGAVVFVR